LNLTWLRFSQFSVDKFVSFADEINIYVMISRNGKNCRLIATSNSNQPIEPGHSMIVFSFLARVPNISIDENQIQELTFVQQSSKVSN